MPARTFTDTARARLPARRFWALRLVVGLALAVLAWMLATAGTVALYALGRSALTGEAYGPVLDRAATLSSPGAFLATLAGFAGLVAGIALAARLVHGVRVTALMGVRATPGWRDAAISFAIVGGLGLAAALAAAPFQAYERNLDLAAWAVLALPALLVTLVQVFAEELAFRGYLPTVLAARFRSPLVWAVLPALLFGAMHLPNAAAFGRNAWLVLLAPTLLGLMAMHLGLRAGSLGPAVGVHLANNVLGLLVVGVPGPAGQMALWQYAIDIGDVATVRPMILGNLAFLAAAWGLHLWLVPARIARGGREG